MIKAPFNFVPLSDKVYLPSWADQISQDIPFSDSVSGCIDLTITAKSPIFIRNGHTKDEADAGKEAAFNAFDDRDNTQKMKEAMSMPYNQFCNIGGRPFIPAASIKGEVRNILEIMSFSRMRVDINTKFAQREWYTINRNTPESFKKWYEKLYPIRTNQSQLRCGYLRRSENNDGYVIVDCGIPYRIGLDMIDLYLCNTYQRRDVFKNYFSKDDHGDFNINQEYSINNNKFDPKTARFKYFLAGNARLRELHFSIADTSTEHSTRLKVSREGAIVGDIVFTGQPGYCKWRRPTQLDSSAGKFYEFVFGEETGAPIPISELDFMHFKFIYSESDEWERVKEDLETSYGVPVFFRKEKGTIKDFGLAYLYKLPYEKSPYDILAYEYEKQGDSLDLAQCIFGNVETGHNTNSNKTLKGRVHFSDAFSDNALEYQNEEGQYGIRLVLNSPKASYYPIYIRQDGNGQTISGEYKTYNDGQLSGWKRYLIRQNGLVWENCTNSRKTDTILFPLQTGTIFNGKIRFHNLKPIELGALLSALSFHSTPGCYHQLGQGKPYGLGKTEYSIKLDCNQEGTAEYYMALFEEEMNKKTGGWLSSSTISSLITMSKTEVPATDANYMYMVLQVNPNRNDFGDAKDSKEYLQDFRTLQRRNYYPDSLLSHIVGQREKEKVLQEEKNLRMREDALNHRHEEFKETMSKLLEMMSCQNWAQALVSIDEAKDRFGKTDVFIKQDDIKQWMEVLVEKEREIQASIRKEEGLSSHLSGVNKLGTLQGKIKSWIKTISQTEGRDQLSEDEQATLLQSFLSMPEKELKSVADRKKKIWMEFDKILGADFVDKIFQEVFREK